MPWLTLYLLELPSLHWLWGFRLSTLGGAGLLLPLVLYLAMGALCWFLGWILEPVLSALKRRKDADPRAWQFAWAGLWAWGVIALATPIFFALSPDSCPGTHYAWIAVLLGALAGCGIAQGLLMGLRTPLKSRAGTASDDPQRGRRLLTSTMAIAGMVAMGHSWAQISPPRPGTAPPPNVLLVTLDTVNITRLCTYGYEHDTMPTLSRLAQEGVRFDQAYAHIPLTQPSHANIFFGLQPQAIGVYENARPTPQKLVSLAEVFRSKGYFTAGIPASRVMLERYGTAQGFDRWPERSADTGVRSLQWHRLAPLRMARMVFGSSLDFAALIDDARLSTGRALEAVAYAAHRPWFLWVHYYDPHAPYTLPASVREQFYLEQPETDGFNPDQMGTVAELMNLSYAGLRPLFGACFMQEHKIHPVEAAASEIADLRRIYDAQLRYTDHYLGELLDRLREQGQLENTLVVVAADHGEALYERGYFGHNYFLHQDEVHVPLIFWWPGKIQSGVVGEPVALSDLYPTILQLADKPLPLRWSQFPEAQRGRDLSAHLTRRGTPPPPGPVYLQQVTFARSVVTPEGEKLIFQAVKGRTEYAANPFPGPMWLWYALGDDPGEWQNRAGDRPDALPDDEYRRLVQLQGVMNRLAREIEGAGVEDLNYQGYLALAIDEQTRKELESLGYISGPGGDTPPDESECEQPVTRTSARERELAAASEVPETSTEETDE